MPYFERFLIENLQDMAFFYAKNRNFISFWEQIWE